MEKCVTFLNSRKQRLVGMLHTPEKATKSPAIVCCHGFGRNKVDKFRFWVRIARELCKNGFIVLRFDFSGHGDSEGKMDDISISQEINDLECAINYLKNLDDTESDKIGIIGHSLGGEVAVLESTKNASIKTIVLLAPVVDYKKLGSDFQRALTQVQKSESVEVASHMVKKRYFDELQKFKPLEEIEKINAPVLIIHGSADERVNIEGSKDIIEKANKPKKLVVIGGADHNFSGYQNTMFMISKTVDWFLEHLK